jgi:putative MATE family efflux protein
MQPDIKLSGPATPRPQPKPRAVAYAKEVLRGPILITMLKMAAPNLAINGMLAVSSGIDAFYIGKLGPDALAGVSATFPVFTLMQGLMVGGIGIGVTSAVARAVGAGDTAWAGRLAGHALLLSLALAAFFAVGLLMGGRPLYQAMGVQGESLRLAVAYSNVLFGGAFSLWAFQALSAVVRGSGNMIVPAALVVGGELVHLGLAPLLIFGLGPIPGWGIAGGALSVVLLFTIRLVVLGYYVLSGRSTVRPSLFGAPLNYKLFRDILRVSIPASVSTILSNANILAVTIFAGGSGALAVAGYGMCARFEYLLSLILFGLGAALVPMVGMNVGAGQVDRAHRVGWTGAAVASLFTGVLGLLVAVLPEGYMHLFTADPMVTSIGASYLRTVGPTYAFFGCALALFFASQGAGKPFWPLVGSCLRFVVTVLGGAVALHESYRLTSLFVAVSLGFCAHAALLALSVKRGAWGPRVVVATGVFDPVS